MPHIYTEFEHIALPDFPKTTLHHSQLTNEMKLADGTDFASVFLRRHIAYCMRTGGTLCNTLEGLEGIGIEQLRKTTKTSVWAVGPLLPRSLINPNFMEKGTDEHVWREQGLETVVCVERMDQYPPASILYVSFGSQFNISEKQMKDLALGLEASGRPFIWSIRPPLGLPKIAEFSSDEKMGTSAIAILSHRSTGCFLSHCGWNSVMESLSKGVPIIGWPMGAEQFFNVKLLVEEVGVCMELGRGQEEVVGWEKVERAVRVVMGDEEGNKLRRMPKGVQEMFWKAVGVEEGGLSMGSQVSALRDSLKLPVPPLCRDSIELWFFCWVSSNLKWTTKCEALMPYHRASASNFGVPLLMIHEELGIYSLYC
ncbi:hypothetical protein AMTRI_Chr07g26090 [Amborella trichopoda]